MSWIEALRAIRSFEGKVVEIGVASSGRPSDGLLRFVARLGRHEDRGTFVLTAGAGATLGAFDVDQALFESAEWASGLLTVSVGGIRIAIREVV